MLTSIIIPSIVRESLYPLVSDLLRQTYEGPFEVVIVAQPCGRLERARLPADPRIVVHEAPLGLGIGRYRQLGAAHARGDVLAWIDDDERPRGPEWLARLTAPIRNGQERVVTSGCHIPLGHGYIADSISWLGLPGGGYPGFETMWPVDAHGYTNHLCTGNFAIARGTLAAVGGFDAALTSGNEDTDLADRLHAAGVPLKYAADATVLHAARTRVGEFARWHLERGRAHRQFLARESRAHGAKVAGRLRSSLAIIGRAARTRYLPGVLALTGLQYACQAAGFLPRTRFIERLAARARTLFGR